MDMHAESMKRREENNLDAVVMADHLLRGELPPSNDRDCADQALIDDARHALAFIMNRYGIDMARSRRCESVEDMLCCNLEPHGIMFDPINLAEEKWAERGQCILAFLKSGEAVALYPSIGGYRYVRSSTGKSHRVDKFVKFKDNAYVVFRPYTETTFTFGLFVRFLLKLASPKDWLSIVFMTAAISLLGLVVPAINNWVLEGLVPLGGDAYAGLVAAGVLFLTVEIVAGMCTALKSVTLSSLKTRLERSVQGAFLARVLMVPLSQFRNQTTGRLSSQMKNCSRLVNITVDLLFATSVTSLFSLVYIPQMFSIAPALLVPALVVLTVELVLSVAAALLHSDIQKKVLALEAGLHGEIFSSIKGIEKLKSAGALSRVYGRWAKSYRKVLDLNHNPSLLVKLQPIIPTIMSSLSTVVLYAVAFPSGVTGAQFVAFNASFALATAAVRQAVRFINSAANIGPLVEQIRPSFEIPVEQSSSLEYVRRLKGKIQVEDLGFSYGQDAPFDLHDISLTIEPGEKVAFVGPSGCGKSTLLRVIMGLEDAAQGQIYFDGKPIDSINRRSLGRRIGSVFQFSRVMPGTIRSNVQFGTGELSDEEIWEALDMAAIGDLVRGLPQQLDTEISETSAGGFSGGQKQCLLLARTFARKPSILFLDEATSALDNITQQKVVGSMHASKATVLMVAHRLSTVKLCDRIVVLDKGAVVEVGTYNELMELGGLFSRLVAGQIADN